MQLMDMVKIIKMDEILAVMNMIQNKHGDDHETDENDYNNATDEIMKLKTTVQ